jgi:dienelactone hydrolase
MEGDDVSNRPIRMFHGSADNWVPMAPCRDYVKRLQQLGRDVQLTEYAGANHSFDNPLSPVHEVPDAQVRARRCLLDERQPGPVNRETSQPFTFHDTCIERGARVGYDAHAAGEAMKAVEPFLASLWNLSPA